MDSVWNMTLNTFLADVQEAESDMQSSIFMLCNLITVPAWWEHFLNAPESARLTKYLANESRN